MSGQERILRVVWCAMPEIAFHFTSLDWGVLIGYLLLTTLIGHALRGKQASIRDFFLGGRSLPWQAVCGSIIATEISALTFIGVPGMVFAPEGDLTYLQWGLGSVLARILVGLFIVPAYYEKEIFSPYDFMGARLGETVRRVASFLFFVGSILGQAVRLLVTALILRTVTGMSFEMCIVAIALVAILWTWMGGMTTVIWTDVIQFGLFVFGGLFAAALLIGSVPGGVPEIFAMGDEAGKLRVWNFDTDPALQFTFWTAVIAMPFQNMAAFGTDQLNAQRMFCCRSMADARKAIIWSSISLLITVLMLFVGVGLYAYYQTIPPTAAEAALFTKDRDYVFPVWITTVVPTGLTGLIMAGAFAAAISSLDSILAALSQTTLSLFSKMKTLAEGSHAKKQVLYSRVLVILWGFILAAFAIVLDGLREGINMVSLAFGMVAYTYGPLLGILLLALVGEGRRTVGIMIGVTVSVLLTLYIRPDVYNALMNFGILTQEQRDALVPGINFAWLYPLTTALTFGCGLVFGRRTSPDGAKAIA